MKIDEGIYRVDGIVGANAYMVESDVDGLVLIDAGMPGSAKKVLAFIATLGRAPGDLSHILITHADIDHVGAAAELVQVTGAKLAIAEEDAPVLRGTPSARMQSRLIGRVLTKLIKARPAEPTEIIEDGQLIAGLRVMSVPGHTRGSVAFVRDDGVVFSGDTVLGGRDGRPAPPRPRLADDIDVAIASYERILALKPRLILPGHGGPLRLG